MDKRTSAGIAGDLSKYTEFSMAEAMTKAAANPAGDGGIGAGLGMGIGMAMANRMAQGGPQTGPWGSAPAAGQAPPPPPPADRVWHVATAGQTEGPYSRADLGRMATAGQLTRETHVWTPGAPGWQRAGEIDELAQLFTVQPPPPPPAD
jgi:hypothetical protein